MKKTLLGIFILVLAVGGLGLFFKDEPFIQKLTHSQDSISPQKVKDEGSSTPPSTTSSISKPVLSDDSSSEQVGNFKASNPKEVSFLKLGKVLRSFQERIVVIEDLTADLKSIGLKPTLNLDKNPYTGEMAVIRTTNTIEGTRYFHAQVFKDESGNAIVQHMSFEYQKGEKAFERAIEATKAIFNINQKPSLKKKDFISWRVHGGHEVWIKVMDEKDLKDDPYNAYEKSDVGTIRVAMELDPHGQYHGHQEAHNPDIEE